MRKIEENLKHIRTWWRSPACKIKSLDVLDDHHLIEPANTEWEKKQRSVRGFVRWNVKKMKMIVECVYLFCIFIFHRNFNFIYLTSSDLSLLIFFERYIYFLKRERRTHIIINIIMCYLFKTSSRDWKIKQKKKRTAKKIMKMFSFQKKKYFISDSFSHFHNHFTHLMSYRLYFIIFIRMKSKPQLSGNLCLLLIVTFGISN